MLSVHTRHYAPCTLTDINYRRCRFPKWIQEILPDGRQIRTSARTRSWEKAEINARKMEGIADPNKPAVKARVKIVDAIDCFRDDEQSRHLSRHSEEERVLSKKTIEIVGAGTRVRFSRSTDPAGVEAVSCFPLGIFHPSPQPDTSALFELRLRSDDLQNQFWGNNG